MYETLYIAKAAIGYAFEQVRTSNIQLFGTESYHSRTEDLKDLANAYSALNAIIPDSVAFGISWEDRKAALREEI